MAVQLMKEREVQIVGREVEATNYNTPPSVLYATIDVLYATNGELHATSGVVYATWSVLYATKVTPANTSFIHSEQKSYTTMRIKPKAIDEIHRG